MTEILEPFKMPGVHVPNDPKCPFCPGKKNEEHYITYGGSDNDGEKLGKLINEPEKFGTSIEADARPKDGKEGKDGRRNQVFIATDGEQLMQIKGGDLEWKFQAHHAISGKQCLQGDPVEKFIKASETVKYDTGYSVNNPQNGIWLPSFPEDGIGWPDKPKEKYELAKKAMNKFKRQFHLGHHNISVVVDGLDTETDENYVDYIKGHLKDLNTVLIAWRVCPEQDEEKKHLGTPRVHAALDHISDHVTKKLKGLPGEWTFFVSRHARDYTIKTRNPSVPLDFET